MASYNKFSFIWGLYLDIEKGHVKGFLVIHSRYGDRNDAHI